jgi:hypothetical protein
VEDEAFPLADPSDIIGNVCRVVVDDDVNWTHCRPTSCSDPRQKGQEGFRVGGGGLHEDWMWHALANATEESYGLAPNLIDHEFDWPLRIVPGMRAAVPSIEAGLVEVDERCLLCYKMS